MDVYTKIYVRYTNDLHYGMSTLVFVVQPKTLGMSNLNVYHTARLNSHVYILRSVPGGVASDQGAVAWNTSLQLIVGIVSAILLTIICLGHLPYIKNHRTESTR